MAVLEEAARLEAEVRRHKTAIGHHRRQLHQAAAALAAFEADCRRRGIRIVKVPVTRSPIGEGSTSHGRTDPQDPA